MPKSSAEIAHFDALRWDDQEKIRALMGEDTTSGDKSSKNGKVRENPVFSAEYSKSSRAKCRACEENILKGVIRISKMELPDEPKKGIGLVPHWRHLDCFIASRDEIDATDLTPEEIPGFSSLQEDDKKDINLKFGIKKTKKKPKKEKDQVDGPVDEEKLKEKEVLMKQTKKIWQVRDLLQTSFELKSIKDLLEVNGCTITGGESRVLERCTDGLLFGKLEPCPECNEDKLDYSAEKGYSCHGNMTEWTNCTYRTFNPKRSEWKVPKEFKEDNFLTTFKLKIRKRKFPSEVVVRANAELAAVKEEKESGLPLQNRKIALIGKLKESKASLQEKVEALGGKLTENISGQCFCCISSPGEVLKSSGKMTKAESLEIPVVAEEYLDAIKNGGAQTMLTQFAIAPWGGEKEKSGVKRKMEEEEESSSSKKSKVTLKGGAVVDPDSQLQEKCHLLSIKGEIYTAVLGLVNLIKGWNSYYKLQVLEHDKKKKYYVFRSWGRVGTPIGDHKLEQFYSKDDAVVNFLELYYEKTGNIWKDRKNFVKKPNKMYPIDIDYGQDDELMKSAILPGSKSKLAVPVQELIKFIFDIQAMKDALVEFEIDLKKMPLGKLSKKQIETAYSCLSESLKYIDEGITGGKILDVSTRFYTLIPHDFGLNHPPLLNNSELINMKIKMLDSLLEIEVAYNILKQAKDDEDPVDVNYESLNTSIEVLPKDSDQFKMISEYVSNTHAKTHTQYSLSVDEVFDISRKGERQRFRPFKDLHNRKLLWHGSRSTNFVGILSQGLRIAPPEAPVTGYMFGKGVYFADMASKSANYCATTRSNNTGLMLLCEVALGNMYELTKAKHITKLPAGKHSCKGLGKTSPDAAAEKILPDGATVPLGEGVENDSLESSLLYNEYIVYDTAQVNMKYLVKLKFDYNV